MKSKFIIFSIAALFVSLSISSAYAETDQRVKADIPFDFYAGPQKMSAGTYYIGLDVENDTVAIGDDAGRHTVLLLGSPADGTEDKAQLVFDRSGDSYFLKEVDSSALDFAIPESKAARASVEDSARVNVPLN